MSISRYLEIDLLAPQNLAPSLVQLQSMALDHFGCLGIEDYSLVEHEVDALLGDRSYSGGDIPPEVIEEIEEWQKTQSSLSCKLYFRDEEAAQRFLNLVQTEFKEMQAKMVIKDESDWAEEWKQNYHPLRISSRVAVIPTWERGQQEQHIPYPVYIYPGRGFGTGSHETTWMCLELLDMLSQTRSQQVMKQRVLDFGCGSGILGILAYKLGMGSIDLYDIDAEALENCQQNLRENFFEEQLSSFHCFLPDQRQELAEDYQLILANILMNVLLEEKEWLLSHLAPGGTLILSGILQDQVGEVIKAYQDNALLVAQKNRGDWCALLWRKV